MTNKMVVPVDLSSEDPPELRFAAELARATQAEILLLHVIDYVPMLLPVELPGGYPVPQIEIVREAVVKKLERMAIKVSPVRVTPIVESGGAAQQIVEVAEREKANHIVLGSHSRRGVKRLVLGSVADRVAHTAHCPVTIVRE
jgi:nucleotide-binding universal stress UspA family protein